MPEPLCRPGAGSAVFDWIVSSRRRETFYVLLPVETYLLGTLGAPAQTNRFLSSILTYTV